MGKIQGNATQVRRATTDGVRSHFGMTGATPTLLPTQDPPSSDALRRFELLDGAVDGTFARITALAARALRAPFAAVAVVDGGRVRFASVHGEDELGERTGLIGLCPPRIDGDEAWVVADAAADARTSTHPLVTGAPGVRSVVAVPLPALHGRQLGTLCVLDVAARSVDADGLATLRDLAGLLVDELELRLQSRRLVTAEAQLREEAEQLADTLQSTLLPPMPPTVPGMDIAARFRAGEVGLRIGGDFYDVFRLGANDWGIVLGDACGRGAAPASLAATARWCIRAAAVRAFSPSAVLRNVNAALVEDREGDDQFCTALFARLELDTCGAWVTVANAGHPLPILVRASYKLAVRGSSALPLGLFADFDAGDERVGLGPGDFLVMYTDGITEARDGNGRFFGEDGLLEVLKACVGAPTAAEVADAIMAAAAGSTAVEYGDDAAVLVVRVPSEARTDPLGRVVAATGVPADELALPQYPHDSATASEGQPHE
jgi:sigma-B regulation protein RsbU (phosphoserine phosphatase)